MIRTDALHKAFGETEVLKGIDIAVRRGETLVILGASGSGKSTLLRCLNFLEMPTSGHIYVEGELQGREVCDRRGRVTRRYAEADLVKVRTKVGMVFQHFNLFPHMTAVENVMEGPRTVLRAGRGEARERAMRNLEKVGLADKADAYPAHLSGGQQQRVAIARALAMEPHVMLFDEATSALDPELVGEVLQTMNDLSQEGMTMIIVTHEIGFAYSAADHIVYLHEGLIHEQGPPDQILVRPERQRTRDFLAGFTQFRLPEPEF